MSIACLQWCRTSSSSPSSSSSSLFINLSNPYHVTSEEMICWVVTVCMLDKPWLALKHVRSLIRGGRKQMRRVNILTLRQHWPGYDLLIFLHHNLPLTSSIYVNWLTTCTEGFPDQKVVYICSVLVFVCMCVCIQKTPPKVCLWGQTRGLAIRPNG